MGTPPSGEPVIGVDTVTVRLWTLVITGVQLTYPLLGAGILILGGISLYLFRWARHDRHREVGSGTA